MRDVWFQESVDGTIAVVAFVFKVIDAEDFLDHRQRGQGAIRADEPTRQRPLLVCAAADDQELDKAPAATRDKAVVLITDPARHHLVQRAVGSWEGVSGSATGHGIIIIINRSCLSHFITISKF